MRRDLTKRLFVENFIEHKTLDLGGIYDRMLIVAKFKDIFIINDRDLTFKSSPPAALLSLLENDEYDGKLATLCRCFARCYTRYNPAEDTYILSRNLIRAFSKTSMNFDCDRFPKEFNGYIDFNDTPIEHLGIRGAFKGAFVDIYSQRMTIVLLHKVQTYLAPEYHSYDLDSGKTLEEVRATYKTLDDKETDFYQLVVAAVMYISSMPEDMVKELNTFPRSEKRVEVLKKHYSSIPVKHFGKFFTLPKTFSDKTIVNRGHFAFRRAGAGRQMLKYTWISPSKPYSKGVKSDS